jgi:amidohydrolase
VRKSTLWYIEQLAVHIPRPHFSRFFPRMSNTWQAELDDAIDRRFDEMVALRRHLHAHPEPSGEEFETSLNVYQKLGNEGFGVRLGPEGRGVIADDSATDAADQPLIALRADMDALHIQDAKNVEYRSTCPGIMHACGHDAHTAIVFGTLIVLRQLQQQSTLPWPINIRGVFQPAEETTKGALEMISVGALEGVSVILANHMDPSRRVGRIGLRPGVLTANCDDMRIRIHGCGGHAARPHEARDPIAAAAQLINALYLFIPRSTDSMESVVVTVGQVVGGDNPNVIPEWLELDGTLRTLDREVRKRAIEKIRTIAHGIGQTSDTTIDVQFGNGSGSVDNDPALVEIFRRATESALGREGVEAIPRPSMGAEDFAFYLDHVPGAMARIGCTSDKVGGPALHSPSFDIDEEALRIAARVMARSVVLWCDPNKESTADAQFVHGGI